MKNKAIELLNSFDEEIRDTVKLNYPGYLGAMSCCFNHSYVNAYMVMKTMPNAVMVADELSWLNIYGREVTVKRDQGIPVIVPGVMTRTDDKVAGGRLVIRKMDDQNRFEAVKVQNIVFYPKIDVLYDISQTVGRDINKPKIDSSNWEKNTSKSLQGYKVNTKDENTVKTSILYAVSRYFGLTFPEDALSGPGQFLSALSLENLRIVLHKIQTTLCDLIHQIIRQKTFDLSITRGIERTLV